MKKSLKDLNIEMGTFKRGANNQITDVEGVKVGHVTYSSNEVQTGITAIIPHSDNTFRKKYMIQVM